jgi:hypothetical protein
MAEHKRNLTEAEEKAAHAHRDAKLDDAVEDTFPASDPPSTTPPAGTRKAEQIEAAERESKSPAKPANL